MPPVDLTSNDLGVADLNGASGSSGPSNFWTGIGNLANGFLSGVSKFYNSQQQNQTALTSQSIQSNAIVNAVKYIALAIGLAAVIKAIFSKR